MLTVTKTVRIIIQVFYNVVKKQNKKTDYA